MPFRCIVFIVFPMQCECAGREASGIYAHAGVDISKGIVTSSCSDNGSAILCGNGNINIKGGTISVNGAKYEMPEVKNI